MKGSTKNIIRMHGYRLDRALHNYLYFVFYDLYVRVFLFLGRLLQRWLSRSRLSGSLFKMVFDRYHAKVLTLADAEKILELNEDVVVGPDRTERIIPFQYANKIILKEPEFIAVMDCPCRLVRENPCEPVNVCMAVGRTMGEFWMEHGAKFNARRITQQGALEILHEAHDRGNITTAWFKVATGGRTGVICSCCTCCCGGLEGMRIARSLKGGERLRFIAPSGYTAVIDFGKCVSCGTCERVCIFNAVGLDGEGRPVQDGNACMGCGLCIEKCQGGARIIERDPAKGLPLDIDLVVEELGQTRG